MSFTINLQTNHSEENRMIKSISNVLSVTGVLRDECSIMRPKILIESATIPANVNYMSIPEFGRSYFVTDIRSIRNGLIEVSGRCDALSSFASQIAGCTGIVKRQENDWNLYLNDPVFKTYANPTVVTRMFPSGFNTTATYILITV